MLIPISFFAFPYNIILPNLQIFVKNQDSSRFEYRNTPASYGLMLDLVLSLMQALNIVYIAILDDNARYNNHNNYL